MALFHKKPDVTSGAPLYSVGAHNTMMIIGLGNPGAQYDGTRHNLGFMAIDDFAGRNDFPQWINKKDLSCHLTQLTLGQNRVILVKPTTFMNNSGQAAAAVQHFYKINNASTLAIYDELALEFGQLRSRTSGSNAGHNGVGSLISHIGEDFARLRIGIANEFSAKADASDFVLGKFTKAEQQHLGAIIKEAGVMITEYIYSGQLPHETRSAI